MIIPSFEFWKENVCADEAHEPQRVLKNKYIEWACGTDDLPKTIEGLKSLVDEIASKYDNPSVSTYELQWAVEYDTDSFEYLLCLTVAKYGWETTKETNWRLYEMYQKYISEIKLNEEEENEAAEKAELLRLIQKYGVPK